MNRITLKSGSNIPLNRGYNCDFMKLAEKLPDKSVGLIMADPPYFEVKGDFDFIWESFGDYLKDVEKWAIECKRILTDNGSLFWWGNVENIAYSQIILDKYFNFENHITWRKTDSMQYQYYSVELSRKFNTHNERCLFYSNEVDNLKNPISKYLKSEFIQSGSTNKEISKLFPSKTGGLTGCVSNWLNGENVITEEQYNKIRNYLKNGFLNKEYSNLISDYEKYIRFFRNNKKLEDVITHSQESQVSRQYDHETIKAIGMIKELLQTTTRKDTLVFIPFWGSGTDSEACHELGLNWIACEINEKHFNNAKNRQKEKERQPLMDFT